MAKLKFWEILVPTHFNDHSEIEIEHHKKWDAFVQDITKGLTIQKTSKGIWINQNEIKYEEKMIPVRIACTKKQIRKIADFTALHYKQEAITFCKISDEGYIFYYDSEFKRIVNPEE